MLACVCFGGNIVLEGSRGVAAVTHPNIVIDYRFEWRTASFTADDMLIAACAVQPTAGVSS